jgi:small-conductance mechanosensitive channel
MNEFSLTAPWEAVRARGAELAVRVCAALILFVVLWLAGNLVRGVLNRVSARRHVSPDLAIFLSGSARLAFFVVGAVTVLGTIGVDVTALVASLGLLGFALGFALKDMISNVLAGVLILMYKPFRRDDLITIDKFQGVVVEINLRYTVLSTPEARVLIPNATLFTTVVTVAAKK